MHACSAYRYYETSSECRLYENKKGKTIKTHTCESEEETCGTMETKVTSVVFEAKNEYIHEDFNKCFQLLQLKEHSIQYSHITCSVGQYQLFASPIIIPT